MKNNKIWAISIVVLVFAVLSFIWWGMKDQSRGAEIPEYAITQTFDQSVSDGVLTVKYLSSDFGLATTVGQILLSPSVVSPCGAGFNYCFYLSTTTYNTTNFESAGISITKRLDLKNATTCTDSPPLGYDSSVLPDARKPQNAYSTSVFKNMGDSGAGHIVTGTVYRLFYNQDATCYEIWEKIAYTQFANYPDGSIIEFTQKNIDALTLRLENVIDNISIKGGVSSLFP